VDSEALIKEMQKAMVNLYNHDESLVLCTTNDTTPSPQNNSLDGLLPQKLIIIYWKQWSVDNRCVVLIIDFEQFYDYCM